MTSRAHGPRTRQTGERPAATARSRVVAAGPLETRAPRALPRVAVTEARAARTAAPARTAAARLARVARARWAAAPARRRAQVGATLPTPPAPSRTTPMRARASRTPAGRSPWMTP